MDYIASVIRLLLFLLIPILIIATTVYWIYRLVNSFKTTMKKTNEKKWTEAFYTFTVLFLSLVGFYYNMSLVKNKSLLNAGEAQTIYEIGHDMITAYTPLASKHLFTFLVFFILGIISYFILKAFLNKLAPIPYVICCSILIINIAFMLMYITHTYNIINFTSDLMLGVVALLFSFICLTLMYIVMLKESMSIIREREQRLKKEYKNKYLNKIYIFFIKYNTMPIFSIILAFPLLIIIQLILVLFGQQPDSFIKVFFETSSYNYSKIIPPDPIIIPGDSHYLCTVSARGHEKIVKPLRLGIRRNKKILVNRQLLIANAFENILEEYTPKFHKFIRYIYDKYGYPISKHINRKLTADFMYFVMKPLEWIFLIILYCVDKNPENRINTQYSELRQ